ncbi:serine/arginine repetitive matrix protein 2 [Xyrichtys novacula]|uniref:Serine/arginine repetitive matrix protein 2 n=1 Tax=Xyrichtys novacula TaxID=13765 RepID=A0AAV1GQ00_XYRNO|nr:serine/arginine repetitive matrix protein 2 [Xyrichtys novacula]
MPSSGDETICPKFQPNIFDPSRCHDCLRQRHLHAGAGEETAPQQKTTEDTRPGVKIGIENGTGSGKGALLTPIQSQAEERDTSSKEDSDGLSVVSSYCGVNGGRVGYEESSLCILSPDCELYICDGDDDDSTDSCRDQSNYQEFSDSISAEDEYLPICRRPSKLAMTRLDPRPHRANHRAWMDEAQSRDSFTRQSGLKEEKRESGYFSLGRASGAHLLRDNSPSAPFRHFERGHPIFNTRNVEPKDAIPFRNPNLGVASERQGIEAFNEDLPVEILPPDPYEIAVEVEAQVGPRSPSPTPFKIAESLASTGRKGFNRSYGQGNPSSQQSGRYDPSRSSSPSRGNSPFRRSESTTSLSSRNFDGGGWSRGMEPASRNPSQGTHGRRLESGTLPRNFKSLASSVKPQPSSVSDFRSALRKTEARGTLSGRSQDSRSSSPSRRDHNSSSQMSLRKNEITTSPGRGRNSRTSSPSRRHSTSPCDSPPRRNYSSLSQSPLRRSESTFSLSSRGHSGRCGSPIREGYDIESQALLRNLAARNGINDQEEEYESTNKAALRQGYDRSPPVLRKTESSPVFASQGREGRSSSPGRRGYETPQYQLRKTDTRGSLHAGNNERRNASPLRRSYEAPSLRNSEIKTSTRDLDSHNSLPSRTKYDSVDQRSLRKIETSTSHNSKTHNSRNSSPLRKGNSDPPGYSILRHAMNGESNHSSQRTNTYQNSKPAPSHSPSSWRESSRSHRSSSLSRATSTARQTSSGTRVSIALDTPRRSCSSSRSGTGRHSPEDHSPSRNNKKPSHHVRSPSPQIQIQRYTSSQSSMESSESGQLSVGSTGRTREEYVMMADVPKVKMIHQREEPGHFGRTQNQQPSRKQELFKPASHSLSKHPSREWDDTGETERDWHYSGSGYLSRAHSSTSLQRSGSPTADEGSSWKGNHHRLEQMQMTERFGPEEKRGVRHQST